MDLSIDEEHVAVLRELLDSAYRDMKVEIADTNVSSYKQELRTREAIILDLLTDVGGPLPDRS